MNCPHHCEIFNNRKWSYKDLPVRYSEFGTVYRYEQSGELQGLKGSGVLQLMMLIFFVDQTNY